MARSQACGLPAGRPDRLFRVFDIETHSLLFASFLEPTLSQQSDLTNGALSVPDYRSFLAPLRTGSAAVPFVSKCARMPELREPPDAHKISRMPTGFRTDSVQQKSLLL